MAIRNLIDGQTIKIDNHNRGEKIEWGTGIHLHKRMNMDRYAGAEVIIYIDNDKDLEFRSITGGVDEKIRLRNEISRAFKNKTIRKQFINSFYKSLQNILDANHIMNSEEKYCVTKQAAMRIIRLFGLKDEAVDWFEDGANEIFSFSQGTDSDYAIVALNVDENSITVGCDMDYIIKML